MAGKNEINKPITAVIGQSNVASQAIMQQSVVIDPLPHAVKGMNVSKIEGINGKGESGKENAFMSDMDLIATASNVGNVVNVVHTVRDAVRFVFPVPNEEGASYHIIYDVNRTENPLALFKKSLVDGEDGKKTLETQKLSGQITLVESEEIKLEELMAVARILVKNINSLSHSNAIKLELQAKDLLQPKKEGEVYDFIKVFSDNIGADDKDDIKMLRVSFANEELTYPQDGLSHYSAIKANGGIVLGGSYSDMNSLYENIAHKDEPKESDGFIHTAIKTWARDNEIDGKKLIEAQTLFGVDRDGNIIMQEDGNVPYKAGGTIYGDYVQNIMAEYNALKKVISDAVYGTLCKVDSEKYGIFEGAMPSDQKIAEAEAGLVNKAREMSEKIGKGAEFEKWITNEDPIISLILSGDETKINKARNIADNLTAIVREATTKELINKDPSVLIRDGYFKNNRQLGVQNSSPKLPSNVDYKNGEQVIMLSLNLPKVVKVVGKDLATFKNTKMVALQIILNKEGKARAIQPLNTMGMWGEQQKLSRVLHAITKLSPDMDTKKLERAIKDLSNYGGTRKGKDGKDYQTDFGLGAILKNEQQGNIAEIPVIKTFIQDLRAIAYPNGEANFGVETLEKMQEKVAELSKTEDLSLKAVAKSLVVLREKDTIMDKYLNNASINTLRSRKTDDKSVAERENVGKLILNAINGDFSEPKKGIELSASQTGAYIKALITGMVQNDDIKNLAKALGFKARDTKSFKIFNEFEGNVYPALKFYKEEIYSPKYIKDLNGIEIEALKENIHTQNVDYTAIKETMNDLKAYYDENKETYVKKDSYYKEEIDIDLGMSITFDDLDIKDLSPEIAEVAKQMAEEEKSAPSVEEPTEAEVVAQEEIANEGEVIPAPSNLLFDELEEEETKLDEEGIEASEEKKENDAVDQAMAIKVEI